MAVHLHNAKSFLLQLEASKRDASTQTDEVRPMLYNIGRGGRFPGAAPDVVPGLPPRGRARAVIACRAASEAFHRIMES